jgi:hypothetical protein
MNKKALTYWSDWAETFFLFLLLLGLVIGVLSPSAAVTYLIAFFAGAVAGRIIWFRKNKIMAPYVLIVIGFVLGFIITSFRGERGITFLLFLLGAVITYYLFKNKVLKDVFV